MCSLGEIEQAVKICWRLLCCLLTPGNANYPSENGASHVSNSSGNIALLADVLNDRTLGSMVSCALLGRNSTFNGNLSSAVPDKLCALVCLQVFQLLSQWLESSNNSKECGQHPCWQEYLKLPLRAVEKAACDIAKGRSLKARYSESLDCKGVLKWKIDFVQLAFPFLTVLSNAVHV